MDNEQITMSRIAFERMQAEDEKNDRWRNVTIIILRKNQRLLSRLEK